MIVSITRAKINLGYGEEAWEYAKGIAKLAKEKYNAQVDCLQCYIGDIYEITFVTKYESLSAMEEGDQRFFQDPEYIAIEEKRTGPTFSDLRSSVYTVLEV